MEKVLKMDKLTMGVCYYPEHWPKSMWAEDLLRMKKAGIEVVRIAEFAWSKFEPEEGRFTYEFFDEFLDLAEQEEMKVIFCTPTATPPAWLTEKYEEVLNGDKEGNLYRHGARRHYNYNSPKYIELTRRIVEKVAEHYGGRPCIIGWQIDNELNCETSEFYSRSDDAAFRKYLKNKYETLEQLNEAWGTVFWNQDYTGWDQVHIPEKTIEGSVNPHRVLDYLRFVSESACEYAALQSEIIRKYKKADDFVTTNGMFGHLDNHKMNREYLDGYTYDSYPNFAYCLGEDPKNSTDLNDRKWSRNLAEVRSISPNFGIMEQQSGANGWNTRMEAPAPKPGQLTLWTMQSIAHGADYISYFRWRTCTVGTEIYWHGILDYSSRDNRRLAEVKEVTAKFDKMREISGARYEVKVGVLKDYDNIWDAEVDVWHGRYEKVSQKGIFQAAQRSHTPLDYVYLTEDLDVGRLLGYEVLFYPHALILTEERTALLQEYVRQGGKLVLGCRTGQKNMHGHCVMEKLPGLLREFSGVDVPEYTFLGPADETSYVDWDGTMVESAVFQDILEPLSEDVEVCAAYTNNYYKGAAGLLKRRVGKGEIYYFGGAFTEQTAAVFLQKLGVARPYQDILDLPGECELAVRVRDGKPYYFILNYASVMVEIEIKRPLQDLFEAAAVQGKVTLAPYEAKVLV